MLVKCHPERSEGSLLPNMRLSPALSRDPGACSSMLRDLGRAAQVSLRSEKHDLYTDSNHLKSCTIDLVIQLYSPMSCELQEGDITHGKRRTT